MPETPSEEPYLIDIEATAHIEVSLPPQCLQAYRRAGVQVRVVYDLENKKQ